jgi:hypothetical protein
MRKEVFHSIFFRINSLAYVYKISVGIPEETDHLGDMGIDGRITLK